MAVITSYSTLQTAVGDYLARSDLTSWIPNFVQNWEERFYRQPRNWGRWMEATLSVAISNGVASVPDDFLGLATAYLDGVVAAPLQWVTREQLLSKYPRAGATGQPKWISRDAGNFIFGPVPAGAYTLEGTYYAKPDLLRDVTNGQNWLTENAPDLLLYGALLEAEPFLKNDSRIPLWQAKYAEALQDYRDFIAEQKYTSGSGLQVIVA